MFVIVGICEGGRRLLRRMNRSSEGSSALFLSAVVAASQLICLKVHKARRERLGSDQDICSGLDLYCSHLLSDRVMISYDG